MSRTFDPMKDFERLTESLGLNDEFARLAENLAANFGKFADDNPSDRNPRGKSSGRSRSVATIRPTGSDTVRYGDRIEFYTDLPGVDPETIDVTIEGRTVAVSATRTFDLPDDAQLVSSGRRHGKHYSSFELGDDADAEGLSADYDRGVLLITVPLVPATQPRKITVNVSDRSDDQSTPDNEASAASTESDT